MRLGLRFRLLIPPVLLLAGTVGATVWAARHAADTVDRRIAERVQAVEDTVHGPPTFRLNEPILRQMRGLTGMELVYLGSAGDRIATLPEGYNDAGFQRFQFLIRSPHPNEGGRLTILYPESLRRAAIDEAVRPALWLGGLGGLVAFTLAAVTARRLVARIRDIESRTRDIAAGTFQPIPLPAADDEVRDLVQSVNRMSQTLSEYRDRLQSTERLRLLGQFSGGLAHQLRNAASGARLAVQLYLRDSDNDREPLRVALRQLERIEDNLRQFLNLGRPDAIRRNTIDIAEILDTAVTAARPQARHAGTMLIWTSRPLGRIEGDAEQLGHLISNLLVNALDAAGPNGTVELRAESAPESIRLEVVDSGPGPAANVCDRIYEPFVTGKQQGVGLGLAIAKQVAEAHGGRIGWFRRGGQTVFHVELPRNPP